MIFPFNLKMGNFLSYTDNEGGGGEDEHGESQIVGGLGELERE